MNTIKALKYKIKSLARPKICLVFALIVSSAIIFGFSRILIAEHNEPIQTLSQTPNISQEDDFDILEFWANNTNGLKRIESTPINLTFFGEREKIIYDGKYFGAQDISFDSPNWVDAKPAKFKLNGTILYPRNVSGSLGKVPAVLDMHGLNGRRSMELEFAMEFVALGSVALIYDHPGHGDSEGPAATTTNFNFQKDFERSSHQYLTICGAIQAIRVLESLPEVDATNIISTGHSYGALNTMYISSIYSSHIKAAFPVIAVGGWEEIVAEDAFYSVMGVNKANMNPTFWTNQALRIDPKYYIKAPNLPPTLFRVGTSDDFFTYPCINITFNSLVSDDKWYQVHPNGHHALFNDKETANYFFNYTILGGPDPPEISYLAPEKTSSLLGDSFKAKFTVNSEYEIKKVELSYRYYNILGDPWRSTEIFETSDGSGTWEGVINPGMLSSEVEYLLIVHLNTTGSVWFTSQIYSAGIIANNLAFLTIIGIIAIVAIPSFLIVRRRYRKNVKEVEEQYQKDAKKYLMIEIGLIGITEVLIYISLFLPWVIFLDGVVIWNHAYIFNNLMTWTDLFGVLSFYLPFAILIYWLIAAWISLFKPMIGGWLSTWYPFAAVGVVILITGGGIGSGVMLGIGMLLPWIAGLSQIPIGIWKRKYQTKIGLHNSKIIKKEQKELS